MAVIPAFGNIPLFPEANHLKQKFLPPVQSQAGHPFEVTVGEDRHGLFLLRSLESLREVSGAGVGRRRYGNAKKA
jgi:hypothetical protein